MADKQIRANLPAKSTSKGIQKAHVRMLPTRQGPKPVIINPHVHKKMAPALIKREVPAVKQTKELATTKITPQRSLGMKLRWQDVLTGDTKTATPISTPPVGKERWLTQGPDGGWTLPINDRIYVYSVSEYENPPEGKYYGYVYIFPASGKGAPAYYSWMMVGYGSPIYEGDIEFDDDPDKLREYLIEEIDRMMDDDSYEEVIKLWKRHRTVKAISERLNLPIKVVLEILDEAHEISADDPNWDPKYEG